LWVTTRSADVGALARQFRSTHVEMHEHLGGGLPATALDPSTALSRKKPK
jgi:hypothetical protein